MKSQSKVNKACPERVKKNLAARGLLPFAVQIAKSKFVPIELLLGPRKSNSVVNARKVLYRLLFDRGFSTPEIGELLERNSATVREGLGGAQGLIRAPKQEQQHGYEELETAAQ